jgi:hypothetical protein
VDISVTGVQVRNGEYAVQSLQPSFSLDGADALPADDWYGNAEPEASAVRGTWAFDADAAGGKTLQVTLDLVLEKRSGPGPSTRRETVQQSVAVGAA